MREPIHPGETLREDLDALGMGAAELARRIKVPTNRITGILNGQRTITGDTALRLGRFFGTSGEFWLNLQKLYELRLAEERNGAAIARLPTLDTGADLPPSDVFCRMASVVCLAHVGGAVPRHERTFRRTFRFPDIDIRTEEKWTMAIPNHSHRGCARSRDPRLLHRPGDGPVPCSERQGLRDRVRGDGRGHQRAAMVAEGIRRSCGSAIPRHPALGVRGAKPRAARAVRHSGIAGLDGDSVRLDVGELRVLLRRPTDWLDWAVPHFETLPGVSDLYARIFPRVQESKRATDMD